MKRSLKDAMEGHYGKAIHALGSIGITLPDDVAALRR